MAKRITNEDFIKRVSINRPDIELLGRYKGCKKSVLCRCKIDGYEWSATADSLMYQKRKCPKCAGIAKKTHEEFINEMSIKNNNIIVIGQYIGNHKNILVKCKKCGYEWESTPTTLLKTKLCPKCNGVAKLTNEEFLKRVSINTPFILPLEDYTKNHERIKCKCLECTYEWDAMPTYFNETHKACPACLGQVVASGINTIDVTHPDVFSLLKNNNDGKLVTYGSNKKLEFICPECGELITQTVKSVINNGLSCKKCGDGISYPNKFMYNVLSQVEGEFITEKLFGWSKGKLYDFYIPNLNLIVEIHGLQHYERQYCKGSRTLKEEQENDRLKKELALSNGFNESQYIIIDARYSKLDFIKKSIINSLLYKYYNFDLIDFNLAHNSSLKSLVMICCGMWNEGLSIKEIDNKVQVNIATVRAYLRSCNESNLCIYPKEKIIKEKIQKSRKTITIICLNNLMEFNSFNDAHNYSGASTGNICSNCKGIRNYAGKDKFTGEPLHWMYYEDYLKNKKVG